VFDTTPQPFPESRLPSFSVKVAHDADDSCLLGSLGVVGILRILLRILLVVRLLIWQYDRNEAQGSRNQASRDAS
jgi:hypothetical protein